MVQLLGSRLIGSAAFAVQDDASSREELVNLKEPLVLNLTASVATVGAAPVPAPNLGFGHQVIRSLNTPLALTPAVHNA